MPKYRTIPTYIEAAQFDGTNGKALGLRLHQKYGDAEVWVLDLPSSEAYRSIGQWTSALIGDWLVTFPSGKKQLMIDSYFRERYEEAPDA